MAGKNLEKSFSNECGERTNSGDLPLWIKRVLTLGVVM